MIWHTFFQPFIEFGFMRRALVVCFALSLSTTMLGVLLLLRRMSLMGDALSHAILPGVAAGYLLNGMSLLAMSVGGFIAGIAVALVAGWVSRRTPLKEDASFAGFYLGSLALGVTLVSLRGSSVDLLHLLFGSILAVDSDAAFFVTGVASLTLLCIALFYRGLVSEAFDSAWLQVNARRLAARPVSRAIGTEPGGGVSGARHVNGGRADDVARGSGALLGANAAGHFVAGGGDRRVLRLDGIEPFVGSEFTRRARHRADRQRTVFYFSVFWHAQPAGRWLAQINGVRK